MSSSRPGCRRPPPACAAVSGPMPPPAPSKKNFGEEFRILFHCRRAGRRPEIVLGGTVAGVGTGAPPRSCGRRCAWRRGTPAQAGGEGGVARP